MSAASYYGKDYKPCIPTMDKQLFHQAEGISTFEWKTLVDLHEAYCSMRFQWESFKANAMHPDRWGKEYDSCREKIANLLVDAIHEIEARIEVRKSYGYEGGGTIFKNQANGMTKDDAIEDAAAEACEECGVSTNEKELKHYKASKKKGGSK